MSQSGQQDLEGKPIDGHLEQLKSASDQPSLQSRNEPDFGDSSGRFFSIYSKISEEEDKKMTDRWQTDADSMLIFTGLFSAAVAALLAVSAQDLRQDPQDIVTFYLENIYQILANSNQPQVSIPSPVAKPPPFSPPRSAVWVNSLWFLSLVISLTCALMATSLQQWARRYVRLTQPARRSPEKRARMRAFFAGGVKKMHVPWAVEALPALLHLSLFLFFSGVVVFLGNINQSVYVSVVWWIALYSTAYGFITLLPMLRPDSPYYTPLSTPVSFLFVYTLKVALIVVNVVLFCCAWIAVTTCAAVYFCLTCTWVIIWPCTRSNDGYGARDQNDGNADSNYIRRTLFMLIRHGKETWHRCMWLPERMPSVVRFIWDSILPRAYEIWNIGKAAEQATLQWSSEIDLGILDWTIPALGEELEEFFEAIPGFFNSKLVKVPKIGARRHHTELYVDLRNALIGFLRYTLSSDSISESIKKRRLDIYLNAMNAIYLPYYVDGAVTAMIVDGFSQLPQSIEMGRTLARWFTANNQNIAMAARYGVATILGEIQTRDDLWKSFAKDQFGLPEQGLQDSISHGNDSVLLAIFLHMTREVFHTDPWNPEILSSLPKFNIHNTRVELQIELCFLWNQIALKATDEEHPYIHVLREIRHIYVALPPMVRATLTTMDTPPDCNPFEQSSYPSFNIATDHLDATITFPTQYDDPDSIPPEDIIRGDLSSTEYLPSSQGSLFPSQATRLVLVAPHRTDSPTLGSSLSMTNLTDTMHPDELAPTIFITEMEETSQTPAETLSTFPYSERGAATPPPSTVPRPSSVSAKQPDINEQQDIATPPAASHVAQISSTANQMHLSTANIGATLQVVDSSTSVSSAIISGPPSSSVMMPALDSSAMPVEHSSSVESAFVQPGHVSHPLGSLPSCLPPTHSDVIQQMTSDLDTNITTRTRPLSARERDETHDVIPPTPMEVSLHAQESELSTHEIPEDALPPEERQLDQNQLATESIDP